MCENRNLQLVIDDLFAKESENLNLEEDQAISAEKNQIQNEKKQKIEQIVLFYNSQIIELNKQYHIHREIRVTTGEMNRANFELQKFQKFEDAKILEEQLENRIKLIADLNAELSNPPASLLSEGEGKTPESIFQQILNRGKEIQAQIQQINHEILALQTELFWYQNEIQKIEENIAHINEALTRDDYSSVVNSCVILENECVEKVKALESKYAKQEEIAVAEIRDIYRNKLSDSIVRYKAQEENEQRRNELFSSITQLQVMPSHNLTIGTDFFHNEVIIWSTQPLSLEQHTILDELIQEILGELIKQQHVTINMVSKDCYSIVFNDPKILESVRETFLKMAQELTQSFAELDVNTLFKAPSTERIIRNIQSAIQDAGITPAVQTDNSLQPTNQFEADVAKAMQSFLSAVDQGTISPNSIFTNSQPGWKRGARTGNIRFDPQSSSHTPKR